MWVLDRETSFGENEDSALESSVVTCVHGARIFEMRNPKREIRNKSKSQISKAQNTADKSSTRNSVAAGVRVRVLDIRIFDFEFV